MRTNHQETHPLHGITVLMKVGTAPNFIIENSKLANRYLLEKAAEIRPVWPFQKQASARNIPQEGPQIMENSTCEFSKLMPEFPSTTGPHD